MISFVCSWRAALTIPLLLCLWTGAGAQNYPGQRVTGESNTSPASTEPGAPAPAPAPSAGAAASPEARQLVDNLYTPAQGLPIRDLILEVECSELVEENGIGNLLPSSTDRVYYKFPNRLRVDTVFYDPGAQMDGKQFVIIRDGSNMWLFSSMGQYPMKKGADTQEPSLELPFSLQKYPQDANDDYTLVGNDAFEGIPVKVVQIQNPARPDLPTRVWIDPVRRVPLQLVTKVKGQGSSGPVEKKVIYRDIKQLEDGRYLPMRLEIYVDQVLRKARVYRGAKVNAGLQDSLFEPMKGFLK